MSNYTKNISVFVAWPYANAPTLHIGHLVGALLPADIFARFNRKLGNNVLHVTGTDMHGTPVSVKAHSLGKSPEEFAIFNHKQFLKQLKKLNINFNLYTNTHTTLHAKIVNNLGQFLYSKGFLFPKKTKMFYDPKAKQYLPDRYIEGECPYCGYSPARGDQCDNCGRILDPLELINPKSKLTGATPIIKEVTNLYLDLPKFKNELESLAQHNPRLRPHVKEMTLGFLKEGLKPRPVTRNMDWGIKVDISGFEDQVWYVWFEAVIGYLSAPIEFFTILQRSKKQSTPHSNIILNVDTFQDLQTWESFWKGPNAYHYYFLGKDNIPFHTIIWPAQLLMYNYKYQNKEDFNKYLLPQEHIFEPLDLYYDVPANNFLNMNDAKISKSTGNYLGLNELLEQYSSTSIRYAFARLMPETKDANFTMDKFKELVNNELVATLGNLIYRTLSFAQKNYHEIPLTSISPSVKQLIQITYKEMANDLQNVQLSKALNHALKLAAIGNKLFNDNAPWKSPQSNQSKQTIFEVINIIINLINLLSPYIPKFTQDVASFIDSPQLNNLVINPDTELYKPLYLNQTAKIKNLNIPVKKIF